ncbi:MAG: GNAT family N-acetyltransferase [Halopseudomonas aestusnigri]
MIQFEVAQTQEDWNEALVLATKVFSEHSSNEGYGGYKTSLWYDDSSFAIKNLIVARNGKGDIVGMVRLVPRVLFQRGRKLSVAGFSSICLDPKEQGKGSSIPLMNFSIDIAKNRGFDIALLFARRAMDHYYPRLGFWGVSSYNRLEVKIPDNSSVGDEVELAQSSLNHIELYDQAYQESYENVLGRIERNPQYWQNLVTASYQTGRQMQTIKWKNQDVGYVIFDARTVFEIASREPQAFDGVLRLLSSLQKQKVVSFLLSVDHKMLVELKHLDLSVSYRECPWGGHMVRLLNVTVGNEQLPSYDETLSFLRVRAISYSVDVSAHKYSPFNICAMDEF